MFHALEQRELQPVPSLVSDGKIWEDEVRSWLGSIEIGGTGDSDARQNWDGWRGVHLAACYRPRVFQAGVEHECGIVRHGNINPIGKDSQFHDRWRVDWSTVGGR